MSVFAEKLSLAPAELGLIIRARDIEIHGSPLPYTGEEEGEDERPEVFLGREEGE